MRKYAASLMVLFLVVLLSIGIYGCSSAGAISNELPNEVETNKELTEEEKEQQLLIACDEMLEAYILGKSSYIDSLDFIEKAKNETSDQQSINQLLDKLSIVFESKKVYSLAQSYVNKEDYLKAIEQYRFVAPEDSENYTISAQEIVRLSEIIEENTIKDAEQLANSYFYSEAIAVLEGAKEYLDAPHFTEKINEYKNELDNYELYEETVNHIFFHSLIADTDRAFDGDSQTKGFNYWMCTVDEAIKTFEYLYERDYVLVSIHELYDIVEVDGKKTVKPAELYFPKGKKPIVLSLDDINYYKYMDNQGFADRLIVDDKGKVANVYFDKEGKEWIGRDYDVIPVLDQFVEKHPDFAYKGAKGTIALTGYEGILGYRTDLYDSETIEQDTEEALKIINVLKNTGWDFASHGYGHLNAAKISLNTLKRDTAKWKKEVMSLIGDTNVYVYPFGAAVYPGDPKFDYLVDEGFNVLCGVSGYQYNKFKGDAFLMTRRNIDGYVLNFNPRILEDLIDPYDVMDKRRPAFE